MAKTKMLDVQLHIPVDMMNLVNDVIKGEGVRLIHIKPLPDDDLPNASAMPRQMRYANGVHDKGISGKDLVLKTLDGPSCMITTENMEKVFVRHGFAGKSASPSLSVLKHAGKIKRDPVTGMWSLARPLEPKPTT